MLEDKTLAEAKRLHTLGLAIHWLLPKSKRPVESKWTTGPRKDWGYLKGTYKRGMNVGVRLGQPSKINGNFLAVIDVDVKSKDAKHNKEVTAALSQLVSIDTLPEVVSGRGNGSRHYYVLTAKPVKPFRALQSPDEVKVDMPSVKPSKREIAALSAQEIEAGVRLRQAWEISIMGEGQQVVLPPSIHPDSGRAYAWRNSFTKETERVVKLPEPEAANKSKRIGDKPEVKERSEGSNLRMFSPEPVNIEWLPISEKVREQILTGDGVEDRSAALLPVASALMRAGLTKNKILSVLTDPTNYLGQVAYDHAQTKDRTRAAQWLWKYTVKKVFDEQSAEAMFREPIVEAVKLTKEEIEHEQSLLDESDHWSRRLDRNDNGKVRPTFKNCKLMLINAVPDAILLGRNEFASQDYWLTDTPWGSKAGEVISDSSILGAKDWCITSRNVEFTLNTLNETVMHLAGLKRWHPVRDYLKTLNWDGVDRSSTWLKVFGKAKGPEPYLSDVSRKVLVAMVARVMNPGCKFDHVLILEGHQGIGKSSLVRALAGDWFSDVPLNIGDKDGIMAMQSKWVIELGELSTMSRTDVDALKAFVTQTHDRMRPPYGRRMEEYPRQSIFIGTTNNDSYLKDPTGARRFWPVELGEGVDWNALAEVRDQLFAEAYGYYMLEEPLYLENKLSQELATYEQHGRTIRDEWGSIIREILNSESWELKEFEIADLAKRMQDVGAHKLSPADVQRISNCLRALGYKKRREGSPFCPRGGRVIRRRLWFNPARPADPGSSKGGGT